MLRLLRACALAGMAVALTACEPAHGALAPIVGGTRELGEPAVVYLRDTNGYGSCTGTLIAPSIVLTAKHCVQLEEAEAPFPASELIVGTGDRVATLRTHRVRYVETTPGAYINFGSSGGLRDYDIAVLVLEEAIADVEPIPIRRDRPGDMIGQSFTAVGYGLRPDTRIGEKYTTTGILDSITGGTLDTRTAVACLGDSGGAMIQESPERRVIGVASYEFSAAGERCPAVSNGYNGLWEHLAMIDRAFVVAGECLGREEACNSVDDDCDGGIDEGCALLGASCGGDGECALAQPDFLPPVDNPVRCESVGGTSICTRDCDPTRPGTGCSAIAHLDGAGATEFEGTYCRRTEGCEGRCAAGVAGELADGESCAADTECQSLACADPGDGLRRCLPPCRGAGGSCPVGEACAAAVGACGYCIDPAVLRAPRQLGEPCREGSPCAEGSTCEDDAAGAYCTHACASDDACAGAFRCEAGRCVRGGRAAVGDPCADLADCAHGALCVRQGERRWCSQLCGDAAGCPDGLECATAEPRVCAPLGSLLGEACGTDGDCATDACEAGVCTRPCSAEHACPVGFACLRDARGAPRCLTRAPSGGGCSAAPRGDAAIGVFVPMLAFTLARSCRRQVPRDSAGRRPRDRNVWRTRAKGA